MLNSDISLYSTMPNHNSSYLQEQNISVCEYNFFYESQLSNNQVLGSFSPLSAIETPSPLNYLTLPAMNFFQDNDRKRTIVKSDIGSATVEGSIKRMKNVVPIASKEDNRHPQSQYFVDKRMSEPTRGKQPKAQEKWLLELEKAKEAKQQQFKGTQAENQIRPKRSQKIGDRIITLQKLVSPFGKTDTASVLKDTADHIKMLYNQIEMLTNPYFQPDAFLHYYHKHDLRVGMGEMTSNGLAERGLCLVPVSFTQNIPKEEKS
ncbi:hypothetical protein MKX03_022574 [Papaver bracteatum]|nr:hypothetical protein MKX03_022574 [Papaver bracteatum]